MAFLNVTTDITGEIGVRPRIVRIKTNNTLAQILTENFLQTLIVQGYVFYTDDIFAVSYGSNSDTVQFFRANINGSNITLFTFPSQAPGGGYATASNAGSNVQLTNPMAAITDVVVTSPNKGILPDFTEFNAVQASNYFIIRNATGSDGFTLYKNDGVTSITTFTQTNQYAVLYVTSNATANGTFIVANFLDNAVVPSLTGSITSGNVVQFDTSVGKITSGPVAANLLLTSAIATPDVGANLITFNITVGQAALASAGSVTLITSSGSKQYKVVDLKLNSGGTNFSGGGGDRLGQVTDGTTVYSVVPAATMQALTNSVWGSTAVAAPASAAFSTSTVAGASLTFKYSGGTTDYTAGSLVMTGTVQRVA